MKSFSIRDFFSEIPLSWRLIALISLILTLALAVDLSPALRGDADWRWDYTPIFSLDRVLIVALSLLAYIATAIYAWRWGQASDRRAWLVVSGAVALTIPIQLISLTINNPDPLSVLMFRATSPFMSGFHEIGIKVDNVHEYLRDFPQLVADYHPHPQRRPPGLILYFAGLERLLSTTPSATSAIADSLFRYRCEYWPLLYASDAEFAAAAGNLLTLAFNAAALWPFFAAAQTLIGRRAALAAALFCPLVPGYVMWAGIWDQALILITAGVMWLSVQALVRRRHWAWPAMGVLISFGSFLSYVFLPLAGFVGLCAALEFWRERTTWRRHAAQLALDAAGFGIGLASLWIVYWLLSGVTFFEMYRATTAEHFAMSTTYGSRLFYNPYDFAFFLGFPTGLLALIAALKIARAALQRQSLSTAHSFAIAAFVMIGTLTVFNLSRAEVGRVWIPYMPLILLAAFALEGGPAQSVGRWAVTACLVAGQLIMMLSVFVGESYPVYPRTMPIDSLSADAVLGDSIKLAGYNAPPTLRPGESALIKLHWQTLQPPPGQFTTFVHLYNAELDLIAQHDGPPRWGQYPTRCWQTGEVITDEITLTIDPNTPPGVYDLIVGMYDPARDNERLPASGANARNLSIVLTQIEVK